MELDIRGSCGLKVREAGSVQKGHLFDPQVRQEIVVGVSEE